MLNREEVKDRRRGAWTRSDTRYSSAHLPFDRMNDLSGRKEKIPAPGTSSRNLTARNDETDHLAIGPSACTESVQRQSVSHGDACIGLPHKDHEIEKPNAVPAVSPEKAVSRSQPTRGSWNPNILGNQGFGDFRHTTLISPTNPRHTGERKPNYAWMAVRNGVETSRLMSSAGGIEPNATSREAELAAATGGDPAAR